MNIQSWVVNQKLKYTIMSFATLDDGRLTIEGGQFKGKNHFS
jgi:hypothetical protein